MSDHDTESELVGTRPWPDLVQETFDWANRLWESPPPPLTQEDAVFVAGLAFALILPAKFGKKGKVRVATIQTCLCFGVLAMAGVNPQVRPLPPEADEVWKRFGQWLEDVFEAGNPAVRDRSETVERTLYEFIDEGAAGVLWAGDIVRGYAAAARRCGRGGWRAVVAKAEADGLLSGHEATADAELSTLLRAQLFGEDGGIYRNADGSLIPNFGDNLDAFLKDKPPLPTIEDANQHPSADDLIHELDAVTRQRIVRRLRSAVEDFPRRSKRSRYVNIVSEHAWRLLAEETNPEQLAQELGVSARPMRREWARQKDRLLTSERIQDLLRKLQESA